MTEAEEDVEVEIEEATADSSPLDDVEESDRAPLLLMVRKVAEISNHPDRYAPAVMAGNVWGDEVPIRSKHAVRWDLSGAVSEAATMLFDPEGPEKAQLLRDSLGKNAFKRKKAVAKLRDQHRKAQRYYGYAWGAYERASTEVTGKPLHHPKSFEEAQAVSDRARKIVCEALDANDDGATVLGMARRGEAKSIAEIELLATITEAGVTGYRLPDGEVQVLLASYDLHRRGVIEAIGDDWTYRRRATRA